MANNADAVTLQQLADGTKEPIGQIGRVRADPNLQGRNVFSIGESASL
jgi:hypothetical protein